MKKTKTPPVPDKHRYATGDEMPASYYAQFESLEQELLSSPEPDEAEVDEAYEKFKAIQQARFDAGE